MIARYVKITFEFDLFLGFVTKGLLPIFRDVEQSYDKLSSHQLSCFLSHRMELRVGSRYRLGRKIGSGSFGDIYLGEFWTGSSSDLFFLCTDLLKE